MKNETMSNRVCPVELAGSLDTWWRKLGQNPRKILKSLIKTGGIIYISEPLFHVSAEAFARMIQGFAERGFQVVARPSVFFSRSVVMQSV